MKKSCLLLSILMAICFVCNLSVSVSAEAKARITLDNLPAYSGKAYVELNGNVPSFKKSQLTTESFEKYSKLDDLGRCGVAFANVCLDTMPTEARGSIGSIKPTGCHTAGISEMVFYQMPQNDFICLWTAFTGHPVPAFFMPFRFLVKIRLNRFKRYHRTVAFPFKVPLRIIDIGNPP